MADFFQPEEEQIESDTIKLGEKEYSQDELSQLVGLGEMAREIETKQNTKIDRVFPEYTKATQRLSESEKRISELEAQLAAPAQPAQSQNTGELTQEQRDLAVRQLRDLGFVTKDEATQFAAAQIQGKELLDDVNYVLSEATESGKPQTTPKELLDYMAEEGIKNPSKAYKLMFEPELDALKEKKLSEIKPAGMVTTTVSTAGAKSPQPVKVTKANLEQLVKESLNAGGN